MEVPPWGGARGREINPGLSISKLVITAEL